MKRFMFNILLTAAAVAMSASCAKDPVTTDPQNGPTKEITLSAHLETETRTQLNGHSIVWKDKDSFGLLASADGTSILGNIQVQYTRENADRLTVTVPEQTRYIYGYYPYDKSLAAENLDAVELKVGSQYTCGTSAGEYAPSIDGLYPMTAAGVQLSDNASGVSASLSFRSAGVCLVEFNIYGGKNPEEQLQLLEFQTAEPSTGSVIADFTAPDGPTFTAGAQHKGANIVFSGPTPDLTTGKQSGVKAYATVVKGLYEPSDDEYLHWPSVMITTDDDRYLFEFANALDLTSDAVTVNLNLSSEKVKHPEQSRPLVSFSEVSAPNTFSASTVLTVDTRNCEWIAVYALPTESKNGTDREKGWQGYSQSEFITNAKQSYQQYNKQEATASYERLGYIVYDRRSAEWADGKITVSDDFLHYNGYWNPETHAFDIPGSVSPFIAGVEHTIAVYAKPQAQVAGNYDEDPVFTTTWTPPAIQFTGNAVATIGQIVQTGTTARATITADKCSKITAFSLYLDPQATDSNGNPLPDNQRVTAATLPDLLFNNKFKDYDPEKGVEVAIEKMQPGYRYMFVAIAIDTQGRLTTPVTRIVSLRDVDFTTNSAVTGIELSQQTSLDYLPVTLTATGASEIRYLAFTENGWLGQDGSESDPITVDMTIETFKRLSGGAYSTVKVEDGKAVVSPKNGGLYLSGNSRIPIDDENDDGSDYDGVLGGHNFYIFFAPVTEGSDGMDLGHIMQLTGRFSDDGTAYSLYDLTLNHAETAPYTAATSEELGEKEPEEPEEPETWISMLSISTGCMPARKVDGVTAPAIWFKDSGLENTSKVWIIRVGRDWDSSLFVTGSTEIRDRCRAIIDEIFSDYEQTKDANASEMILGTFTSVSTEYIYFDVPDMADGDCFVIVAQTTTQQLCAMVLGCQGTFGRSIGSLIY